MSAVRALTPDDAPELTALYEEYEWWEDRKREDVRSALCKTDVVVGVFDAGELVAGTRVLTDNTSYATVFDVIVASNHRGEGIGETLMKAVVDHPALENVDLSLRCRRGLVPYYESVGFELFDPDIEIPERGTEELVLMRYSRKS